MHSRENMKEVYDQLEDYRNMESDDVEVVRKRIAQLKLNRG